MKLLLPSVILCGVLCGVAQASSLSPVGEPASEEPQANRSDTAPEAVEKSLKLEQETRRLIQRGLRAEGFEPGAADGVFGPRTRAALRNWQAAHRRRTTGYLDRETAETLQAAGTPGAAARATRPTSPTAAAATGAGTAAAPLRPVVRHQPAVEVGSPASLEAQFTGDQIASLNAAITELDTQIASTEQESAVYAGGFVKTMIELRLTTLRQTREMLNQRKLANTYDVTVTYTVDGSVFTTEGAERIAALEAEIAEIEETIATQQAEADRYSGGLVRAMALSTVATSRQSLAMLEQQRLALTYGLPQYISSGDTASNGASLTAGGSAAAPAPSVSASRAIAAQGPFGVAMGLSKDHVESVLGISLMQLEGQPNVFSSTALPRSHPSFETYVLKILPTNGVCQVSRNRGHCPLE